MSAKYEKVDMNAITEVEKLDDEVYSTLKPNGKKMLPFV